MEPSALVQKQGGPCAVIAPVQAYLLKIIIMDMPGIQLTKVSTLIPYPPPAHTLLMSTEIKFLFNLITSCPVTNARVYSFRHYATY